VPRDELKRVGNMMSEVDVALIIKERNIIAGTKGGHGQKSTGTIRTAS
jgi:hypothetical protein